MMLQGTWKKLPRSKKCFLYLNAAYLRNTDVLFWRPFIFVLFLSGDINIQTGQKKKKKHDYNEQIWF